MVLLLAHPPIKVLSALLNDYVLLLGDLELDGGDGAQPIHHVLPVQLHQLELVVLDRGLAPTDQVKLLL